MGFIKTAITRLLTPAIERAMTQEAFSEHLERMRIGIDQADYGVVVNNESALRFSATYAAIRVRAENMASLPKTIRQKTDKGWIEVDHPVTRLIAIKPNRYTNVTDFWKMIFSTLDGWGNAFAYIERNNSGVPVALHQLHPSMVQVTVNRNGYKYFQVRGSKMWDGVYPDEDMLHFMLLTYDGITGVNPIEANASSFAKALAARKFGGEFFKKGGNVRAILETEGKMSEPEYESFMKHFKDSSNNFDTPLLEYGIKYKQVGVSPMAAQLLSTEEFSITDIARIFNVPPHMIGDLTRSTFSNIEQQTIQFAQFSVRPTVKCAETELECKLFTDQEQAHTSVKFDINGLMRGDMAARGEWYSKMIANGSYSREDVRDIEGLPRKDGLEKYLYQANMVIVGEEPTPEQLKQAKEKPKE